MLKIFFGILINVLLLGGCAHHNSLPAADLSTVDNQAETIFFSSKVTLPTASQIIQPGYKLRVTNQLDPKLNFSARVNENGYFSMPYGKSLKISSGLTLSEVIKQISFAYHNYFKTENSYQLQIIEVANYLKVSGNISKPGLYLVTSQDRIEDILARVHGESQLKRPQFLQIKRGNQQYLVDLASYFQGNRPQDQAFLIWTGQEEFIFLDQADPSVTDLVYIMGDIREPGGIRFHPQWDLIDYINKAGGFTASSDQDRISVIRKSANQRTQVNGGWIELSNRLILAPRDTIVVGSSLPTRFERRVQLGSMIASMFSALGILLIAF